MDTLRGKFGLSGWDDDTDADDFGQDEQDDGMDIQPPPSPVGQDERRMQVRAYNFWASMLQDRSLPCIEDLEPETLGDFGPYSVLLDFTSGIENPAVPFLGESLAGECDASGEIETLSDVPGRSLLSRITDHYMQILANKAPIGFEAEFVNQRGATVLYRGILLPFSSDDDTIDFIYGVINWKEVADQITTDALLLEIDTALDDSATKDVEESDSAHDHSDDPIADWADGPGNEPAPDESNPADASLSGMPMPSFGEETSYTPDTGGSAPLPGSASDSMAARLLSGGSDEDGFADGEYADDTADMDAASDSDNPDDWSTPLSSLIKPKGERTKKRSFGSLLPDLDAVPDNDADTNASAAPAIPSGYGEDTASTEVVPELGADMIDVSSTEARHDTLDLDAYQADELPITAGDGDNDPQGLYDCLAAARELAQTARTSEDRSRTALYAAVGRAYDVSLAAEEAPEDFAELVNDNGLSVQDRAPMTPVVKLVFGSDYDKTRLTEYAAVLSHAHRLELDRGSLGPYLSAADGGLKGVVQAERRLRREEAGKPVADPGEIREALAAKLRAIDHAPLDDIASEGSEFGVVMIRRLPDGSIVLVGELEDDVKLTEQVARKLIG